MLQTVPFVVLFQYEIKTNATTSLISNPVIILEMGYVQMLVHIHSVYEMYLKVCSI